MAKTFREMVAWQLAFDLKEKVVRLVVESPKAMGDFKFRDQITSAARSVGANIAEGFVLPNSHQALEYIPAHREDGWPP